MNNDDNVKYVAGFLLGVVTGAVAALLLAPSSGKDLRMNIKTQTDAEYAKLQNDMQRGMQDMHTRMDKLSSEMQAMANRSK